MEIKRFERVFLLFTREDEIINGGQSPSGYVKLETLDNKIKISTSIQGIRQASNEEFVLFLFGEAIGEIRFFNAGGLDFKNSKCDMTRDIPLNGSIFNSEPFINIGGAVIVKISNGQGTQGFSCPLVAFKNNKKMNYKNDLTKFLYSQQEKELEAVQEELTEEAENLAETEQGTSDIEEFQENVTQLYEAADINNDESSDEALNQLDTSSNTDTDEEECSDGMEDNILNPINTETNTNTDYEELQNMLRQFGLTDESNNGICAEPMTLAQKEMCENCGMLRADDIDKNSQVNAAKLKLLFNKYFEPYDPFRIRRTDYKWWKVGSPVQLNNLLYQNNIKTPLLFNPQLMMAHFKYKHILAGIYISRRRGIEYIVCGVPAVYNIDEKPYGNFCRWAQLESVKPRYGAFGYWLVYIDIKTGNFLSL